MLGNNTLIPETAHANFIDTVNKKREINGSFLELGMLFKENRDNEYFRILGYDTFNSYIAVPEIAMSRAVVYALIRIYEVLVLEHKVSPERLVDTDWTKLQMITGVITEDNKDELLSKAQELTRSDLRIELTGHNPVDDEDIICPTCGGTGKIKSLKRMEQI